MAHVLSVVEPVYISTAKISVRNIVMDYLSGLLYVTVQTGTVRLKMDNGL